MQDFRNLIVWQRSHGLTLSVYKVTKVFPREEIYGLTSQLRRCAASIPANIAEGCGRRGDNEFARFLQYGMGSASEMQYHLILARDLGYLHPTTFGQLADEVEQVKQMLATLLLKLRADS